MCTYIHHKYLINRDNSQKTFQRISLTFIYIQYLYENSFSFNFIMIISGNSKKISSFDIFYYFYRFNQGETVGFYAKKSHKTNGVALCEMVSIIFILFFNASNEINSFFASRIKFRIRNNPEINLLESISNKSREFLQSIHYQYIENSVENGYSLMNNFPLTSFQSISLQQIYFQK